MRGAVFAVLFAMFAFLVPFDALAQNDVSAVALNITDSIAYIPGLLTGAAYLLAILLCVTGIIKIKEHVENPQTKINAGLIRLFTGGAMFALPVILNAMVTAISGDGSSNFGALVDESLGGMASLTGGGPKMGVNEMMGNIIYSIELVPALLTGVAYLSGLLLGYMAIIKIKEHVENPEQVKIQEGIVRLIIGGALFSLPTIYEAMNISVSGGSGGGGGFLNSILGDFLGSNLAGASDKTCGGEAVGSGFGRSICNLVIYTASAPSFLNAVSYLFGLVLGFWALLKIRDHVLDPRSTTIWIGAAKLIAGGAFFSLPYVIEVATLTVSGDLAAVDKTTFNETGGSSCTPAGLDMAMYCLMADIFGPIHIIINFFTLIAGIIFVMIGIGRLMKNAQDGAKGPGGMGTIMTFLTGGILISFNTILGAFSQSLFASGTVLTYAELTYKDGLGGDELAHAHTVISAIIKFMIIVGLISFVRGWFIMRGVAEGSQNASAMAGITHIIGGALAVNIGPLLSAVQQTLGIDGIGVTFR